mgnify:CR=1 FL=1
MIIHHHIFYPCKIFFDRLLNAIFFSAGNTIFQAEFFSDDTIRLYLGLNDIRLELNGVKTTTPVSSPTKIRTEATEIDTIHSEVTGDDQMKVVVEGLVESVIEYHENKVFVQNLVTGVIDSITTNHSQNTNIDHHSHYINENIFHDRVVTSSPSSTKPEVTESERYVTCDSHREIESVVEGLVDSVIYRHESKEIVEGLVDSVMDSVDTNKSESTDYDSQLENISANNISDEIANYNDENCGEGTPILTPSGQSTNQIESIDVGTDINERVTDSSPVTSDAMEQTVDKTEIIAEELVSESLSTDTTEPNVSLESVACTNQVLASGESSTPHATDDINQEIETSNAPFIIESSVVDTVNEKLEDKQEDASSGLDDSVKSDKENDTQLSNEEKNESFSDVKSSNEDSDKSKSSFNENIDQVVNHDDEHVEEASTKTSNVDSTETKKAEATVESEISSEKPLDAGNSKNLSQGDVTPTPLEISDHKLATTNDNVAESVKTDSKNKEETLEKSPEVD